MLEVPHNFCALAHDPYNLWQLKGGLGTHLKHMGKATDICSLWAEITSTNYVLSNVINTSDYIVFNAKLRKIGFHLGAKFSPMCLSDITEVSSTSVGFHLSPISNMVLSE